MTERQLVVVSAGLGQPSATRLLADRLAASTEADLRTRGIPTVATVVELRDHARDLTDHLSTGFPSPALQAIKERVIGADGLIAVTPVFNASYSGLFKLFFDVIDRGALSGVPVLVAATGGTTRHSLVLDHAMRPLFSYLGAAVVPTAVYAAAEDWGGSGEVTEPGLAARIDRAAGELAAAVAAHDRPVAADPFEAPVPFETLLRRTGR